MKLIDYKSKQGMVLLMALGIIATLSILIFASVAIIGMRIKVVQRKSVLFKSQMIIKSVQNFSAYVLLSDSNGYDALDDIWFNTQEIFTGKYDDESSWQLYSISILSETNFGFIDEERKLNIRTANTNVISRLLENTSGLDTEDSMMIANGIEEVRQYNMSIFSNSFQSIYELLYVPEMNQEVFDNIKDYITVYGDGKVNINTVYPNVMIALCSVGNSIKTSEELVEKLSIFRERGNIITASSSEKIKTAIEEVLPMNEEEQAILDSVYKKLKAQSKLFSGNIYVNIGDYACENSFVFDRSQGKVISSLTLVDDEL